MKTQTTAEWHDFEGFEETKEDFNDVREIGEFLEGVVRGYEV